MSKDDDGNKYLPITSRIGRVAAAWARFEYRTTEIIWHLANVDITVGACITAQIQSQSSRMRALVALVRLRGGNGNLVNELNSFTVEADKLARQRNRFVHDPWIAGGKAPTPKRVEVTADRTLRFEAIETSLPEMDDLWRQIAEKIDELELLYLRIKTELPPWPDTQHQLSLGKDPTLAYLSPGSGA